MNRIYLSTTNAWCDVHGVAYSQYFVPFAYAFDMSHRKREREKKINQKKKRIFIHLLFTILPYKRPDFFTDMFITLIDWWRLINLDAIVFVLTTSCSDKINMTSMK